MAGLCEGGNEPPGSLKTSNMKKIARLRWAGHVKRMDECEIPRKVMEYGIAGGRRVGRPKLRWMDCVMDDIKRLGVKNWWTVAKDRDRWRRILKEAETRSGL
ncbi:hypothetical protein ANN_15095 [Periplaneta americana]|uniref:Uncharacterized protein n=1 Tax=Periplaneta americana TaxID=6978 RepID=A0ABQ8SY47_PERAM|nr:hypothetical protein ANN_15095 [Periplaneta americana]